MNKQLLHNRCQTSFNSTSLSVKALERKSKLIMTSKVNSTNTAILAPTLTVTQEAKAAIFQKAQEQVEEVPVVLKGKLPDWLNGSFVVNGPGDQEGKKHLFDGYALLSKVRIEGSSQRAWANQRFLETDAYKYFKETGKMKWREFGTPVPDTSLLQAIMGSIAGGATDNASVTLTAMPDGKLLALSEPARARYLVEPNTLGILSQPPAEGFPGILRTAHIKVALDGSFIGFTRSFPFGGYYIYSQDPNTFKAKQIAFVRDRAATVTSWVHDFAITEHYAIIVEPPLVFSLMSVVNGIDASHLFMQWMPEGSTRVIVVPLDGSTPPRIYTAPPLFTFHSGNAYEENGHIHLDVSVYDNPDIINDLRFSALKETPGSDISRSRLCRFIIPLGLPSGSPLPPMRPLVKDESTVGYYADFPSSSPAVKCRPHRFTYHNATIRPTNIANAVAKTDVTLGTSKVFTVPGGITGEPLFVPRSEKGDEDDGVVIVPFTDATGTSVMCLLDGKTFQEVCRLVVPFKIPYRFHGVFISS